MKSNSEYFNTYEKVVEAVIMKDQSGFGFVVFCLDPAVAEIVIIKKHNIDGRMEISCNVPLFESNNCILTSH